MRSGLSPDSRRRCASALTFGVLFAAVLALPGAVRAEVQLGDFGLIDHQGVFHQLSRYRFQKAIVLVPQANGCPAVQELLPGLHEARTRWEERGVSFMFLNSAQGTTRESLAAEAGALGTDLPLLHDTSQLVGEKLGVTGVGELLVVDPIRMSLIYRGGFQGIDTALESLVSPEGAEALPPVPATGKSARDDEACSFRYASVQRHAERALTYVDDVAPILAENCAVCHREGGIGPFAMNGYPVVRGFSQMIREVLLTKRMPPMQVDPEIGHFYNARYISDADVQTIVHWVEQGGVRGEGEDLLASLDFSAEDGADWPLGEPDYIIEVPAQEVPATGVLDYRNVTIDFPFEGEGEKWVKAIHFRPGDTKVLHHLLSYVVPPEDGGAIGEGAEVLDEEERRARARARRDQRRFLEGYAPGKVEPIVFPEDSGVRIPDGHKYRVQLHYTTYGKASVDRTRIGLYLHDRPPRHEFRNRSVINRDFQIPPGAVDHKVAREYTFNESIVLYGLRPHMHYRGKHAKFQVQYPNGEVEDLLSVPNYNFAWQPTYFMDEPKVLPAGSKVMVSGGFDNSEWNPGNPDPSQPIGWGAQSWDEMFIGYFSYHLLDRESAAPSGGE